jgi:hypothetical protein
LTHFGAIGLSCTTCLAQGGWGALGALTALTATPEPPSEEKKTDDENANKDTDYCGGPFAKTAALVF